jgi:hypothetical protein
MEKDRALQLYLEQVEKRRHRKFDAQVCRYTTDEHMDEELPGDALEKRKLVGSHDWRRGVSCGALHGVVEADQIHFGAQLCGIEHILVKLILAVNSKTDFTDNLKDGHFRDHGAKQ